MNSYRPKTDMRRLFARHEPAIAESRWSDCRVLTDTDGYTVYAWICSGPAALYHCYVIPELRKLRVMTRLIEYELGTGPYEYARPWPYGAHAPTNPYLLKEKTETDACKEPVHQPESGDASAPSGV